MAFYTCWKRLFQAQGAAKEKSPGKDSQGRSKKYFIIIKSQAFDGGQFSHLHQGTANAKHVVVCYALTKMGVVSPIESLTLNIIFKNPFFLFDG